MLRVTVGVILAVVIFWVWSSFTNSYVGMNGPLIPYHNEAVVAKWYQDNNLAMIIVTGIVELIWISISGQGDKKG